MTANSAYTPLPVGATASQGDLSSEAVLARRQASSQRGFYRALGQGSAGARLIERKDVQATCVPARPWFSIFNSIFYDEPHALRAALPALEREYREAGVKAWSVWVPPGDEPASRLLAELGFACESRPLRMGAAISEIDLEPAGHVELVEHPSWELVARCNDRAHGVLADWSMAAAFEQMDDPASHVYALGSKREAMAALIAREQDGDCYFWFVATVPEAQRHGLAAALMRHALCEARTRGAQTTTLESTKAGERLYAQLGYRSMGRYQRWERSCKG